MSPATHPGQWERRLAPVTAAAAWARRVAADGVRLWGRRVAVVTAGATWVCRIVADGARARAPVTSQRFRRGAVAVAAAVPVGSGVAARRPVVPAEARSRPLFWIALLSLLMTSTAHAHIASNGFLTINVEGSRLSGAVELAMRDAELAVGVDSNRDGKITWGEVRSHQRDLELYIRSKLVIGDGTTRCSEEFQAGEVNERVDGNYLWVPFTASCGSSQLTRLKIDYRLLQGIDPSTGVC